MSIGAELSVIDLTADDESNESSRIVSSAIGSDSTNHPGERLVSRPKARERVLDTKNVSRGAVAGEKRQTHHEHNRNARNPLLTIDRLEGACNRGLRDTVTPNPALRFKREHELANACQSKRKRLRKLVHRHQAEIDANDGYAGGTEDALRTEDPRDINDIVWASHCPMKAVFSIRLPDMVYPKSLYEGYAYSLPITMENCVLREFACRQTGTVDNLMHAQNIYKLEEFCAYYHPEDQNGGEMAALSVISVPRGAHCLLADAVFTDGTSKRYVQAMPITEVLVTPYLKPERHQVQVRVETTISPKFGVSYVISSAARVYERFFKPFLWVANLSKHLIDYLVAGDNSDVSLEDFRYHFARWMYIQHSTSKAFNGWRLEYGRNDFRHALSAHREWLWGQAARLGNEKVMTHTVWKELFLTAIPAQGDPESLTVVTPYVYECFSHIFGDRLKKVSTPIQRAEHMLRVEVPIPTRVPRDDAGNIVSAQAKLCVGSVAVLRRDEGSKWQGRSPEWYAYIQGIEKDGALSVIWLYAAEDTILSKERYPYQNELFFSSHCNCLEAVALRAEDVVATVSVGFFEGPNESGCEFFIRQKYRNNDPAFMTLNPVDLRGCSCREVPATALERVRQSYEVGDTVLVMSPYSEFLEPVELRSFNAGPNTVSVRRFQRRGSEFPPNELLWTDELVLIDPETVSRRCHIKIFVGDATITAPYNRGGTADCFYIKARATKHGVVTPLAEEPLMFRPCMDFEPDVKLCRPLMRGMDLFCGGGNLGRGIEEGGAVQMKWAVDLDKAALHTYRTNLTHVRETALYLGSVNNYLEDAIKGNCDDVVASPGEVDFICAGSPCQGFSMANQSKYSDKSLQNSSLIASVATALDFYRPKYCLLENVMGLASTQREPGGAEYNVFSQLVCCIVGMGYQCQQWTMGAWQYGSPQARVRLFLSVAAPNERLPSRPPPSHTDPPIWNNRTLSLYEAPNGNRFGEREKGKPCPFPFVPSAEAFGDLPDIGDSKVNICIPFPDHRPPRVINNDQRLIVAHVPRFPYGLGRRAAVDLGKVPSMMDKWNSSKEKRDKNCASFTRIVGHSLCPTVTCLVNPACSRTGRWIHYDQNRLITVQEERRAQGIPDDEVLIGNSTDIQKIVGNSVARTVSLVWGVAIREAYFGGEKCMR